jgi:3-oxoacyl-[acyl-carrier protein] reductase
MDKKIALVTGAARGLGESIARKMHAAGYKVALADIDLEQVSAVAASLDVSGATAMPLALDVRRKPDFIAACDAIELRWGGAAVLVNNAGRSRVAALMEITPVGRGHRHQHEGTFLACQVFGKRFADRGYGRIINIASLAGQNGGTATARTMLRPRARY